MERASIEKKPANDEPSAINVDMADSAVTESENQKKIEAVIRHKFDRRVLPAGIIIFLMGQIDRSNMSNAAVLGMEEDLGLVGSQFNEALSLFFVTYILFEIPANFLCKRMGPRIWLSFITFGFGVVTMGMAFITNRASLLACRLLLGLFEAGEYRSWDRSIILYLRRLIACPFDRHPTGAHVCLLAVLPAPRDGL